MDRIEIAQYHVFSLVVCAENDATVEEVEEYANRVHPTGTKGKWVSETKEPAGPCEDHPHEREHYILIC